MSGPASKGKQKAEARGSERATGAEEEEEEGIGLEGVFEEAARHLEAAEAGVGEARWQG